MQPQKRNIILGAVAIAFIAFVGGGAVGWAIKPDQVRIEEKVRMVEVEKQVVVTQEKVRVEVVKVKDTQTVERYRKEKTTSPDGTIREVEERNIDAVSKETVNNTEVKVVEVEKKVEVEKQVDRVVKIDPVLAQWRAGLMVGASLQVDNIAKSPIMVGVEAERRIAGPVWIGVWAMAGSTVQQFQLTQPTAGLKLAVEF